MTAQFGRTPIHPTKGNEMVRNGKNSELPSKDDGKSGKTPPSTVEDDVEDGDIATPKRDLHDEDDQPL